LGEAGHLTRLFANLLHNAARHTPQDGSITLSAWQLGDFIRVSVSDNGAGISAEHLPHLTERFYRVDTARARAQGGAGLGLAICKSIVEAHGGEIQIESIEGLGTTVSVMLRAATMAA
jgi:signal transduction histidine kinase